MAWDQETEVLIRALSILQRERRGGTTEVAAGLALDFDLLAWHSEIDLPAAYRHRPSARRFRLILIALNELFMTHIELETPKAASATVKTRPYTAVVYIHGIGRQRRNEEISRLLDGLDQYSYGQEPPSEVLRRQKLEIEPRREGEGGDVEYITTMRVLRDEYDEGLPKGHIRIYEAYWSHALAGGYSGLRVLLWLLHRLAGVAWSSFQPWRSQQRLKLSLLHHLFANEKEKSKYDDFKKLETLYKDFENWGARRSYKRGSFLQFVRYIRARDSASRSASVTGYFHQFHKHLSRQLERYGWRHSFKIIPEIIEYICFRLKGGPRKGVLSMAYRWRRAFRLRQFLVVFLDITIVLAMADIAYMFLSIGWGSFFAGSEVSMTFGADFDQNYLDLIRNTLFASLALLFLAIAYRVYRFFSMVLADVMFWTTSDEKDERYHKREHIISQTEGIIKHVLSDPNCRRVIVVAHSLGSAIAFETLVRIGRKRRARANGTMPASLERASLITDLVTIGSPIDVISWLFEARPSTYHRYNRILEVRRGSTDDDPFMSGKSIRWVNVSDPSDPISSTTYSVRGEISRQSSVYEWQTASRHVAFPLEAHSGYFISHDVLNLLFSVCVTRTSASRRSWRKAPRVSRFLREYGARICWALCASCVWTAPVHEVAKQLGLNQLSNVAGLAFVGAAALVCTLVLLGRWADRKWPMTI